MNGTALAEMGEDEVLAFCGERADTIRDAEADLLRGAYEWAVITPRSGSPRTRQTSPVGKTRMYGGEARRW